MYCNFCFKHCKPYTLEENVYAKEDLANFDINDGVCPWILGSAPKKTDWLQKRLSIEF
jgi:hypothetical protein